ncbi:TPA: hypothetical protein QCX51_004936 [Bacillus mycoides]|nr:hypothetical protein [Bacillus mycoides]
MKIKTETLDENLNKVVKEYDLNELEADKEGVIKDEADNCPQKTIASIDLPDGVKVSLNGVKVLMKRYRLYAQVCYPSNVEQALIDAANECFDTGVKAAIVAAGASLLTPASLEGAVPAAASAFEVAFVACMGDKLTNEISFKVDFESHRV